jgi:hypothetical protein
MRQLSKVLASIACGGLFAVAPVRGEMPSLKNPTLLAVSDVCAFDRCVYKYDCMCFDPDMVSHLDYCDAGYPENFCQYC